VIVATNFDRLIEDALTAAGVDFDVIASVDALAALGRSVRRKCVVVKLHGDYRDARILNTAAELGAYMPEFDVLLDRVLDEYGLIVCGWSATLASRAARGDHPPTQPALLDVVGGPRRDADTRGRRSFVESAYGDHRRTSPTRTRSSPSSPRRSPLSKSSTDRIHSASRPR